MMKAVQSLDRRELAKAYFFTLTLPDEVASWETIEHIRRRHEDRLAYVLDRRCGKQGWSYVWVKEPHPESGRPHMHGMLFYFKSAKKRPPGVRALREWNDRAWAGAAGVERANCRIEEMRSYHGVVSYVAGYMAKKKDGEWETQGRLWGISNRRHGWPVKVKQVLMSAEDGRLALRAARDRARRSRVRWYFNGVKDGKRQVCRLRPEVQFIGRGRGKAKRVKLSMWSTVKRFREQMSELGSRTTLWRKFPKLGFNRKVAVWEQEEDERGRRRMIHAANEWEFVSASTLGVPWKEAAKIIAWVRNRPSRDPLTIPLRERYAVF
jgi:hypothetical protein